MLTLLTILSADGQQGGEVSLLKKQVRDI